MLIILWVFFAFLVAIIWGPERTIGFWSSFLLSLLLSPLIGLIITLCSETLEQKAYRERMIKIQHEQFKLTKERLGQKTNVIDDLERIDSLLKNGVINNEEFARLKEKILVSAKLLLVIMLPLMSILGCKEDTPKDKAEHVISKCLSVVNEYKPVQFGPLEKFALSYRQTKEGYWDYQESHYGNKLEKVTEYNVRERNFQTKLYGYTIRHIWKSVDHLGNTLLNDSIFCFDQHFQLVRYDSVIAN